MSETFFTDTPRDDALPTCFCAWCDQRLSDVRANRCRTHNRPQGMWCHWARALHSGRPAPSTGETE